MQMGMSNFFSRGRVPLLFFFFFIASTFFTPVLSAADEAGNGRSMSTLKCAACDRSITGQYVTALDKTWHPDHFACAICDKSLNGQLFYERDDEPYCETCFRRQFSPKCASCGEPIAGPYMTALDTIWHPHHFVCATCGRPFAGSQFLTHEGQPYCETCYHREFSPQCAVCAQPITDEYIETYWGDQYHTRHKDELPACSGCDRPICQSLTEGGVRYQDSRTMCNLCRRTAVDEVKAGEKILAQVRKDLEKMGFSFVTAELPLRLVDRQELEKDSSTPRASGRTRTLVETQDGRDVGRHVEEIMILHGLPRVHFAGVIAHELGHVHLFQHRFPALAPVVEEGLCELIAYLWLQRQKNTGADYQIHLKQNSDDPVYGAGFQASLSALKNRTPQEVLEYVRQHRRFPE